MGGPVFLSGQICPDGLTQFDLAPGSKNWNCNAIANEPGVLADVNGDRFCVDRGMNGTIDNAPGGDDGLHQLIGPGPDGYLKSASVLSGLDPNDAYNPTLNAITAGSDGVVTTTPASADLVVYSIVPGLGASVVVTPVHAADVAILDAAGNVIQIEPGADQVLDSAGMATPPPPLSVAPDHLRPFLILPGPNGTLDSCAMPCIPGAGASTGRHPADVACFGNAGAPMHLGAATPLVCPGLDGVLDTLPADGDQLLEWITDGLNRKCETVISPATDDFAPFGRPFESIQPAVLKGRDDWSFLDYQFRDTLFFRSSSIGAPFHVEPFGDELFEDQRSGLVADLSINVTAPAFTLAGQEEVYRVELTNNGPSTAAHVLVSGSFDAGLTALRCSTTGGGACTGSPATPSALFDSVDPGVTVSMDLVVAGSCELTSGTGINGTFTVLGAYTDLVPANDSVTTELFVEPSSPRFVVPPADMVVTDCTAPSLGAVVADDVCGAAVQVTNDAPAKLPLGSSLITWTATNTAGQASTVTQRVTAMLGNDTSCCPTGSNIIQGTSNNDVLTGGSGADCILGFGGQDQVNGGGGNDALSGGDGDDVLNGGSGNDFIFGGSGQDQLLGASGSDQLFGGDGDDQCWGGTGSDLLFGGQGQDWLYGEDQNDQLHGEDGDDQLFGGSGNDTLEGGGLHDTCSDSSGVNTYASCETPSVPNSCADGTRNGLETDVDCGGGCAACLGDFMCTAGGDCLGGACSAGYCLAPTGAVVASVRVTSDWGSGYCAELSVTNVIEDPTSTWQVGLELQGSSINNSWNGSFTTTTGTIGVRPIASNADLLPGESISNIGFCATRSASGAVPIVFGAGGQ